MKRDQQIVYRSDSGRELVKITGRNEGYVAIATCNADTLDELSIACVAAAEEIRANAVRAKSADFAEQAS